MGAVVVLTFTTLVLTSFLLARLVPDVARADLLLGALQDAHVAMLDQETGLRGFLLTRDPQFLQPYQEGAATIRRVQGEAAGWGVGDAELTARLADLQSASDRWVREWAEPLHALPPEVGDGAGLSALILQGKSLFDEYRERESEVRALVEGRRDLAIHRERLTLVASAVVDVTVAVAVALAVRRANRRLTDQILPPTERVRETLKDLAAGDLSSRAVEKGPLEMVDIARDVNALGDALRDRNALVAARECDLVEARDKAERAGQAKTAFLATMSHEIRTPLNAVLGLTDVLLTTELTDEQHSHLETIASSGDALLALINDILDFSKIEAGELDLERAPFDVAGVAYDVAQLLGPQAAGKGLDLLVDVCGDGSWQVVGDGARLRQVVINLVGNAVKFTGHGQIVLTVGGEVIGSRLRCRIAVSDTGIGIPADQHHRLFRSFSQVDPSTTRSYGGTGLGLAISQRIATAMGGDIAVESVEGVGSTFTVTVELDVAAGTAPASRTDTLAGRRLLVVDDNPTNLRILEHQLARYGAECTLVHSGAEALDLVGGEPPFDACLLDLHMPDMDGDEVARRLRDRPNGTTLPLILLSSSTSVHADRSTEFAARLHKPVRPERLERTVRSVLGTGDTRTGPEWRSTTRVRGVPAPRRGEKRRRLRVLVAEDHPLNAQLMELYLKQLGHDSDHVVNGELAVDAVRTGNYDVVLMDAQMPVLGGVDATAAIRCMPGPQPRIVAVTASVLAGDRSAFLGAGADDFLTKPVRMATLEAALGRWTDPERLESVPAEAAAAVPEPDGPDALDPSTVEELRDLGDARFDHLYRRYIDGLDETVTDLLAAAGPSSRTGPDDDGSVARLAHRLKGSSAAMGALALADVCRRLEDVTADSPELLRELLRDLEAESARVRGAVSALLGAPS
ncbi:MAG: multi-sensor hybrid histidine kinase [Blastococcus sp.]|nr:multi-sensor hybrid histidine kinase [Blastococcus sp.]